MNPSLSFSLDERTVAALLQEDESTFNMLGSLLPSAASAALAAAEGQHGDPALAMQQLLQLQAGAGQSADAKREWANAVLEALRAQSKMPGQASLPPPSPGKGPTQNPDTSSPSGAPNPSAGSSAGPHAAAQPGLSPALAQLFPPPAAQQPGSSGSKGNHSSIYHSPFAAHPRSAGNLPPAAKGSAASLMPALPTSQAPMSPSVHTPGSKGPLGMMGARARSEGVSALSRGEDGDAPACFSGESNDSHVERVTSHRSDGREMTEAEHEEMRLKRIQEKNRRNQRKFRARQRAKLEDSEVQVKELSRQVMALERAKVELEARNRQLESAARSGSKESPGSLAAPGTPSQEPSNPKDDAAYFESLSFFVSKVRGEHFSWEQARDMTFKDIAKNVEMYHAMLSRLFEQGAENPESAAHAELVELLALKNASEFQTWKSRPQLIHMQYAMLNEASGASDTSRIAKWQSIVLALQLTPEQKERLLAARTYLLAQMMEIIQERTLIIAMLQGAVPSMEEGRQQNTGYLNASAAAERLQRNVNREHFLCTDFLLAFWQVATPLQQAQCELLAFPWTPDVLAMCNLLAASAGDIADMQRSFDTQSKSSQTPFNALLMPEMANLQEGAVQLPDGSNSGQRTLAEVLEMKAFAGNS
ncbi:g7011 [Coccomyxa viridis]|uniref:G7011 protein n=1 Tax=Coccomyxa viridis TaxID=1274662 RepID=A0ABP1FZ52_9CHLO